MPFIDLLKALAKYKGLLMALVAMQVQACSKSPPISFFIALFIS